MRMIAIPFCAAVTALIAQFDAANAGPWCAYYDAYTYNCGFQTMDQCRATISGDASASCAANYREAPNNREPPPRRKKPNGRSN